MLYFAILFFKIDFMKCTNCGFIMSRDYYRCPYCGTIHPSDDNVLHKTIQIGKTFVVRVQTLLYIIIFNLFIASFLVDWYFNFSYGITFWAYLLFGGIATAVTIYASKKKNIIAIAERIDFFLLFALVLACGTLRFGAIDPRPYMVCFGIPIYMILATLLSIALLFVKSKSKIRPLWTEALLIVHLVVILVLFVFSLVNKYSIINGAEKIPFTWMNVAGDLGSKTYQIQEILIYVAFGFTVGYLINYNIVLFGHIFRQVKGYYGKPRS